MTEKELRTLLGNKEVEAVELVENLNNRSIEQIAKAKRVTYDEREAKQVIEEIKALEYILNDQQALNGVESGDDWKSYVSSFNYM